MLDEAPDVANPEGGHGEWIDEIRPVIHQHAAMLSAAGRPPWQALAIACQLAVMCYKNNVLEDALSRAAEAIKNGLGKLPDQKK